MSLSTIDQSTGNATVISGNVNDKVGNLGALTTTDKSSCVGAINEVNDGLTNLVKRERLEKTTDSVGDFNFTLENNGILVSVRPLRSTDHYNSWWGATIASTVNNTGYSCKAIKDDGTALASQSVLLDVYYI